VRAFFFSILGYFLTPVGVVLMGFFDASVVFFMPLGIDFVAIIMAARHPNLFWLYALLATIGSVGGAAATFWLGHIVGEHGLARLVDERRLKKVTAKVSDSAAAAVALFGIVPPPFPFTPFVLASGALEVNAWTFLGVLAGVRMLRFAVETTLARVYGSQILSWTRSTSFKVVVGVFIGLALIGTIVSVIALVRASRRSPSKPDSGEAPRRRRTVRAATHPR
jgi:membrane protein YqaA with SNARE-associated domain